MRWMLLFSLIALVGECMTPKEAIQRLVVGNKRYEADKLLHPNHSADRREELTVSQNPFAVILGCSDSRVSPEIIFDQGLGDLFIVRVAGSVAGPVALDSIDYGVAHLGASVIVVLGHQSCGAVTAVFQGKTSGIEAVARLVKPAIEDAKGVEQAIKDNVRYVVNFLENTPVIKKLIDAKKLECIGAYYHLGSGHVEILQ